MIIVEATRRREQSRRVLVKDIMISRSLVER
jgi:hypothetical protein